MCFIARPADGEFQFEEDILRQLLKERNYDCEVALQRIDPGKFAFCTKICSKIITAQFTIVLLNHSSHSANPALKIPNPNVHMEYGLMLGFHKHVIPMQRDSESLAFNIAPLDTIKYKPENFKNKAEAAIDDAILRFKIQGPPGRAGQPAAELVKYMALKGLRFSDIQLPDARFLFNLGASVQFNLFDSADQAVFFGNFEKEEPREIVMRTRVLLNNIVNAYRGLQNTPGADLQRADTIYAMLRIELLVPETANSAKMAAKIEEFQPEVRPIPVTVRKPSEVFAEVEAEYAKLEL